LRKQPSFARAAWRSVRGRMAATFAFKMGWLVTAMVGNVYLLRELVLFFYPPQQPLWRGLLLCLGFFLAESGRSVFVNQHWLIAVTAGLRLRAGVRALIYDKTLRLRVTAVSTGQAVSLLSNDTSRLLEACNYAEFLASTPITVVVALCVMLWLIGVSSLAGFAVLLLFTPLQARIGSLQGEQRRATAKITDERVRVMSELLSGIRLLKLYAFEAAFAEKVSAIRVRELRMLGKAAVVRVVNTVAAFSLPVLVTLATFVTNALLGNSLSSAQAFVVLALFNVVRFPLGVLPQATRNLSEALVAAQRVQAFLDLPEVSPDDLPVLLPLEGEPPAATDAALLRLRALAGAEAALPAANVVVELRAASFDWDAPSPVPAAPKPAAGAGAGAGAGAVAAAADVVVTLKPTATEGSASGRGDRSGASVSSLREISLSITRGQLVGVVGVVGGGKSSLLASLLGNMQRRAGVAMLRGRVAYCAQAPWIFAGSLRSNILFGRDFDEARFRRVVRACALAPDLAILPAGDQTEIGERGINLSGGQKARVSLARAVYADADIYLLDDPLSAVDTHVARHLWRRVVEDLRRAGKTVVIVTHQRQFLARCDLVVVVEGGRLAHVGAHADLLRNGVDLGSAAEEAEDAGELAAEAEAGAEEDRAAAAAAAVAVAAAAPAGKVEGDAASTPGKDGGAAAGSSLVVAEDRAVGSVSLATLAAYLEAAGGAPVISLLFFVLFLSKGLTVFSSAYLSYWSMGGARMGIPPLFGPPGAPSSHDSLLYAAVYAGLVGLVVLLNFLQGLLFSVATLAASKRLHSTVFRSVLRARIDWHDSQPTGRTLARFTGDVDTVDSTLPSTLETCLEFLTNCFFSVVLIVCIFPGFLAVLLPLLCLFVFITDLFRRVARELKRLDNLSRAPLVSHATATASGLSTIRAFGEGARFARENDRLVDFSSRSYWQLYALNRWVAIRVDVITTLMVAVTALFAVFQRDSISPGLAGLSIAYALSMAGILQYSMRLATETEQAFVSVERLTYFSTKLPYEHDCAPGATLVSAAEAEAALAGSAPAAAAVAAVAAVAPRAAAPLSSSALAELCDASWLPSSFNPVLVARGWPASGRVEFKSVDVRYREGLPLVLRGVSFVAQAGHTVGIVGRTGSGKTTLSLALFRVLELAAGGISVDGVDAARVNLHQLRRRLSIIPQDPQLWRGSMRYNLDLFGESADADLMDALERVGLAGFVRAQPKQLDAEIQEGGSNLSAGQRQLVCLARALLRGSRIVLLDEATSSLDAASDALVQRTLREHMRGCTILVVAHRLETIADCDRVLVMDGGVVAEFDAPAALLGLAPRLEAPREGPGGAFKALVEATGAGVSAEIAETARAAYLAKAAR
jgi:ATP-binding cassette subfamily C (CFTR/MRP) protein 12